MFVQGLALIIFALLSFTHNFAPPCWSFYRSFKSVLPKYLLGAIDRKKSHFPYQSFSPFIHALGTLTPQLI